MVVKTKIIRRKIEVSDADSIRQLFGKGVALGFRGPEKHNGIDNRANLTNVELSYILETGDPAHNLPPRPFLQPAYDSVRAGEQIAKAAYKESGALLEVSKTAKILAERMKNYVRNGNVKPELKPQTVTRRAQKARQFNKSLASDDYPIYETGELINSLEGWMVRKVK